MFIPIAFTDISYCC